MLQKAIFVCSKIIIQYVGSTYMVTPVCQEIHELKFNFNISWNMYVSTISKNMSIPPNYKDVDIK